MSCDSANNYMYDIRARQLCYGGLFSSPKKPAFASPAISCGSGPVAFVTAFSWSRFAVENAFDRGEPTGILGATARTPTA